MRPLTEKQWRRLLILGNGCTVVVPGRRDFTPLLRRGLVALEYEDRGEQFLPPLRITANGFSALADGAVRFGLPPMRLERPRERRP